MEKKCNDAGFAVSDRSYVYTLLIQGKPLYLQVSSTQPPIEHDTPGKSLHKVIADDHLINSIKYLIEQEGNTVEFFREELTPQQELIRNFRVGNFESLSPCVKGKSP